jgi:hypothetical protein
MAGGRNAMSRNKTHPEMGIKMHIGPRMTLKQAESAVKRAGMLTINARKIKGAGDFGKYLAQIGVVPYGRSILAFTIEHARAALEKAQAVLEGPNMTPEMALGFLQVKEEIGNQLVKAASVMIESARLDGATEPATTTKSRSFQPGQAVFNQVNVNSAPAAQPVPSGLPPANGSQEPVVDIDGSRLP